jgi:serine/threonine protein kinase
VIVLWSRYYFKTTDRAKLEQRRQELSDFWAGFMTWLEGHSRASAEQLLDSSPMQRMLQDAQQIRPTSQIAAPVLGSLSAGGGGAHSGSGGGGGMLSAPRISLGSERCLFSSRRGEMVGKSDFELIASLGEGSFGRVMLCRRKGRGPDGGTLYAMKALDKERVLSDETLEENTEREKEILALMTNQSIPFCVGLKYAFQTPSNLYFVTDFCQGGELFFHLKTMGKFSEVWARFYAAQLVLALGAIHELRIIYRDLKPENVLLDADGYIKITDFGLSKQDDALSTIDGTGTLCGTAAYMAPELITTEEYGMAVDWWSLGCLLYEMLDGWPPFHSANALEERSRIISAEYEPSYRGFSADAVDILR